MRVAMPSIMRALIRRVEGLSAPPGASGLTLVRGIADFCLDMSALVPNEMGGMKPFGGVLFAKILVKLALDESRIQTDDLVLIASAVGCMSDFSLAYATFAGETVPTELIKELDDYGGTAEVDAALHAFLRPLDVPRVAARLGPAAARSTTNCVRLIRLSNVVTMVMAQLTEGRDEIEGRRALLRCDGFGVCARWLAYVASSPFLLDMTPTPKLSLRAAPSFPTTCPRRAGTVARPHSTR